jgi:hypothetical protein
MTRAVSEKRQRGRRLSPSREVCPGTPAAEVVVGDPASDKLHARLKAGASAC